MLAERIEQRNLTVIRIPNNEVNRNFEGVCQYIDIAVKESPSLLCRQPPLGKGAFKRFASKPYVSQYGYVEYCRN